MQKTISLFAAILVALALVGCGSSGSDNPVDAVAKAPADSGVTTPTPPAPPPADVTFTQIATGVVVTPGETFRMTLLEVSCPLFDGTQSCKRQVSMGEIGLTTGLDLQDVTFVHDGTIMAGFVQHEGTLYRFVPTGYDTIWQTGAIEAIATLSPTASPEKATVVVQAADASIDKTLAVVQGEATVQVIPLSYYAPAIVTSIIYADPTTTAGFMYSCPQTVVTGCRLEHFRVNSSTSMPSTEVRVSVGGESWWVSAWTDVNGTLSTQVYVNYYVPPGGSIEVKSSIVAGTGSMWFENITSWSGDKQIAPVLPVDCSAANPKNCKG